MKTSRLVSQRILGPLAVCLALLPGLAGAASYRSVDIAPMRFTAMAKSPGIAAPTLNKLEFAQNTAPASVVLAPQNQIPSGAGLAPHRRSLERALMLGMALTACGGMEAAYAPTDHCNSGPPIIIPSPRKLELTLVSDGGVDAGVFGKWATAPLYFRLAYPYTAVEIRTDPPIQTVSDGGRLFFDGGIRMDIDISHIQR